MRWRYTPRRWSKVGDTCLWFAWHPVVVGTQWVWLEYVSRTLVGWYNDMDGSRPAYEYAEMATKRDPGDQASGPAGAD